MYHIRYFSAVEGGGPLLGRKAWTCRNLPLLGCTCCIRRYMQTTPHHNDGTQLTGGGMDNAIWQNLWEKLAAQSDSWYSMTHHKGGAPVHCMTGCGVVRGS